MSNTTGGTPSLFSYALGSGITVAATIVILTNCLVGYSFLRHGLLKGPSGSFYKLSFNLLVSDTLNIAPYALYLGPASASQSWLLPEGWLRLIPSTVGGFAWKSMLATLCAMAVNRYIAVCKPHRYSSTFSAKRTKITIVILWLSTLAIGVVGQFLLPCCASYMYYKVYSYAQFATSYNYTNAILNIPSNVITSVFVVVAYSLVIWNIRVNNNKIVDSIATQNARKRRRKEIWYAIQLIIVNAIFMAVWILFQILAKVLPGEKANSGIFSIVTFIGILNGSTNSLVLMFLNQEVRGALRKLLHLGNGEMSSAAFGGAAGGGTPATAIGLAGPPFFS